ncbi:hypothetical protein BO99DRAFT_324184 [Aspergillus violaceofuscus CBS 115571]|uniref:Rhodopsin domain-containing protein n=1 Tax=Aspergillus violaceofuscus (strain CBS 115571) TaxID=1450538 RepID=A0A2V5ITG3_ASPV1|nr:hypothetical protein BO99DRAFT_324184 [Aspergillus violaceofuscus CBS 115571]
MPKGYLFVPIQSVLISGTIISLSCLSLRLFVRRKINSRLYAEDYCLIFSWVRVFVLTADLIDAIYNAGLGTHVQNLSTSVLDLFEKLILATACLFVTGSCLARSAHLIFLARIFAGKQSMRYAVYTVTAFITVGSATTFSLFVFACRPISKSWTITQAGRCINQSAIFIAVAIFNICSDILLLLLPVPTIYRLKITHTQKVRFMIVSIMVCVTFIASAVRLSITIPLLTSRDLTYDTARLGLLVGIEANILTIAPCLPAIQQGFRIACSNHNIMPGGPSKTRNNFGTVGLANLHRTLPALQLESI